LIRIKAAPGDACGPHQRMPPACSKRASFGISEGSAAAAGEKRLGAEP
jgi:hypothetical protein